MPFPIADPATQDPALERHPLVDAVLAQNEVDEEQPGGLAGVAPKTPAP